MQFTVTEARRLAEAGRLQEWIHRYLETGTWANLGLSDGLRLQKRWWIGPLLLPLAGLARACGPEPGMEYRVEREAWDVRVDGMQARGMEPQAVPPLIVQYRHGVLSVRDGNHRHEAFRRAGWETCWAVIWFDSEEDGRRFRT